MNKPIEQMAIQAGMNYYSMSDVFYTWNTDGVSLEMMKRLEEIIRKNEREACAKLCEDLSTKWYDEGGSARDCVHAIRARSEK